MNKQQKQVLQSQLNNEQATLKKLKGIYKKALDDVNDKIAVLQGRTDVENLQSIIYQTQYQEALKQQISGILDTLNGEQFGTVSEFLTKSYEDGFIGTMYDLHGQGIPLIFPIDQVQVAKAVTHDSHLVKPFYDKLGENVDLLKKRVANNISRGIAQGQSYHQIARNIAQGMVGDYSSMKGGALYDAMRITRTEGHRITQQAAFEAQTKAKENGADIVKQWDSTLDGRTRDSHARVDGEIRELDKKFSNGLMFPGDPSGKAAEVINCRCALLQRAKWALDEEELETLKKRAEFFGLDKNDNFEDFKKKYLKTLDDNGNSIYNSNEKLWKINRKNSNLGKFSNLKIPMQKKEVLNICKKYNINTENITFKIQRSEDLIGSVYFGSADYNDIGRIDLMPNAFVDETELVKTIVHERHHVEQLRRYGKEYVQSHLDEMEKEAYKIEEEFFIKRGDFFEMGK